MTAKKLSTCCKTPYQKPKHQRLPLAGYGSVDIWGCIHV
nr:MAG TPA: hypothetical protein [Bacteriophage sp.]